MIGKWLLDVVFNLYTFLVGLLPTFSLGAIDLSALVGAVQSYHAGAILPMQGLEALFLSWGGLLAVLVVKTGIRWILAVVRGVAI
jgi:hypothetical protein